MEREEQTIDITYEKCGNYLVSNLISVPEPEGELRKFDRMRKSYLEDHRLSILFRDVYYMANLKKHLLMVQEHAEKTVREEI